MTPDSTNQTLDRDNGAVTSTPRIVVGIDGSAPSLNALQWAARQAELTNATLEVIMTWDWPFAYGRTPMLHESDPVGESRRTFEAAISKIQHEHPSLQVSPKLEHCHPAKALIDASKGADVLVVGSRGHGEFAGMVLGSVSQHCATKAQCPILIHREAQ